MGKRALTRTTRQAAQAAQAARSVSHVDEFMPSPKAEKMLLVLETLKRAKLAPKEGTTTLYRAVSKDELLDVADNCFNLGPNSMGNKWFAESASDASAWGKKFFKWDKEPVWTMEVKVPNSVADKMRRNSRLDGIGPARSADADMLKTLNEAAEVNVLNGNVLPN